MTMRKADSVSLSIVAFDDINEGPLYELHSVSHQCVNRLGVHLVIMISSEVEHFDSIFLSHFTNALKKKAAGFVGLPIFDSFLDCLGFYINSIQPHLQSVSKQY